MPGYRTHLFTGFWSALILTWLLIRYIPGISWTTETIFLCIFAGLLGSIFPDIDINSKMQRLFYITTLIVCFASVLTGYWKVFCALGAAAVIVPFLYHRTTTHNYKFIIIIPMIIPLYISYHKHFLANESFLIYFFFVIGALSHIILDRSITKIKRFLNKK